MNPAGSIVLPTRLHETSGSQGFNEQGSLSVVVTKTVVVVVVIAVVFSKVVACDVVVGRAVDTNAAGTTER